jgi:F-type H+-transporting ATPase subunit epsilon
MKNLELEVITPSKKAFTGMVKSVTVPGKLGNFQILYNHAPILSELDIGRIKLSEKGSDKAEYTTGGGTVEVLDNKILILAESFEKRDEIDVERAEKALERAKERLSKKNQDKSIDAARADAALRRAVNRLKLAGRR